MDDLVLDVTNLRKTLTSGSSSFELGVPALQLRKGRFYGLVGKSGSGKSTILDLLAMVSQPSVVDRFSLLTQDGPVDLAEMIRSSDDARISTVRLQNFGYILQSGGLFSFLSVRENLELPARLADVNFEPQYFENIAKQYEMFDQLDKKPSELSGGQRQRVSILRALCLRPQIVLADEPTASVDENMAQIIVQELKHMAANQETTVLMVSHDIELIEQVADEIFTLTARPTDDNHVYSTLS